MNLVTLGKTLALFKQLTDTSQPTAALLQSPPQKPFYEGKAQKIGYISPESAGISSDMLCDYIEELYNNKKVNIHSIVISRKGKTLLKLGFDSWDADIWKCVFSQSKSITSIAVGMLMADGAVTPSTTLAEIFGKRVPTLYRAKFKEMTLLHLLNMSSGIMFNEAQCMTGENWVKEFFMSGSYFDAGAEFNYNSLNTYMLSAAVTELTGKTLAEFLDSRLFTPLGITDYFWEKCPRGINRGGWGLFIKPEDLVKIAQLLLQNGEWNGKRILSEKYIRAATSKRIDVPKGSGDYDYGFQIWVPRDFDGFLFNGMLGQNTFCFRESGIIICINSGNTDAFQQNDMFPITHKFFNRSFEDTLPCNHKGERRLAKLTKELSHYRPAPGRYLSERLFRKKNLLRRWLEIEGDYSVSSKDAVSVGLAPMLMQVVQNNHTKGTAGYSFGRDDKGFYIAYKETDSAYKLHIGFDDTVYENTEINGEKCRLGITGELKYNEDDLLVLKLRVDFTEFPYTRFIKFTFTDNGLEAVYRETPGRDVVYSLDMAGMIKKVPSMFMSLTQSGVDQALAKLGDTFERRVSATRNS